MKQKGYQVKVAAGDAVQHELLSTYGIELIKLRLARKGVNPLNEWFTLLEIHRLIREQQPDILHAFTIKPIIYAGLILRVCKVFHSTSAVFSVTGLGSFFLSSRKLVQKGWSVVERVYRFVFANPNVQVIFENNDDQSYFVERGLVDLSKTHIVDGAGVDLNIFNTCEQKQAQFSVVFVARLLKDKGVFEFVEAAKALQSLNSDVNMVLVGDIDSDNITSLSQDELNNLVAQKAVTYLGFRADIDGIYKASHVACLPSYREGLPKSLIEAVACGLPIITTDVPGCRQMVNRYNNGILVAPMNSQSIVDAVLKLRTEADVYNQMSKRSRMFAEEKLGYPAVLAAFNKVYLQAEAQGNSKL